MANRMTQSQIVRQLAERNAVSNKTAKQFLNSLTDLAVQQARKTGVFVLPGLGRLKKVQRKARIGRNPQTGEAIKIPAKTTAKFYLAKSVKDSITPQGKARAASGRRAAPPGGDVEIP